MTNSNENLSKEMKDKIFKEMIAPTLTCPDTFIWPADGHHISDHAGYCDLLYSFIVDLHAKYPDIYEFKTYRHGCECNDGYPDPSIWCREHRNLRRIPRDLWEIYGFSDDNPPCAGQSCVFDTVRDSGIMDRAVERNL